MRYGTPAMSTRGTPNVGIRPTPRLTYRGTGKPGFLPNTSDRNRAERKTVTGIRRALVFATAERYASLALNFLTVSVVSRLMAPPEIGVAVLGTAIAGFSLSIAREFATVNYLIQEKELSPERVRSAITVMLVLAIAVGGALVVAAPSIAGWFGAQQLIWVLYTLALGLVLEIFSQPIAALLRREMAFGAAALINSAGVVTTTVVTIALAAAGIGSVSFAMGIVAGASVSAVTAMCVSPRLWVFEPRLQDWRRVVAFGGFSCVNGMLYRLYDSLPTLILGGMVNPSAVALFNRATLVCQIPEKTIVGGVASVVLPVFSTQARAGQDLKATYLHAIRLITGVQWPALVTLALLAHPTVALVLGDRWLAIVPIVRILAASLFFAFAFELNYPLLIALGAVRDTLTRGLVAWPVSAAILIIASPWGMEGMAFGMLLAVPFQALVSFWFVRRRVQLAWSEIAMAAAVSLPAALGAALGPVIMGVVNGFRLDMGTAQAACAAALAIPGWALGLYLTRHPLLAEMARSRRSVASIWRSSKWLKPSGATKLTGSAPTI